MPGFADVFDLATIERMARKSSQTAPLIVHRHRVLTAEAMSGGDEWSAARARDLRAELASWVAYLDAAGAAGILDDDLRERLRGNDADGFRGALAECLVAWYFSAHLGYVVSPRPSGRSERRLDMHVKAGLSEFDVEVKAPETLSRGPRRVGNDADTLSKAIRDANRQFTDSVPNVLAIVPSFDIPVAIDRYQFVEALIGETALRIVPTPAGVREAPPAPSMIFKLNGHLVRPKGKDAGAGPAYRRISAVLVLEERFRREGADDARASARETNSPGVAIAAQIGARLAPTGSTVEPVPIVIHNPFANFPLDPRVFSGCPQLVRDAEEMRWTDAPAQSD